MGYRKLTSTALHLAALTYIAKKQVGIFPLVVGIVHSMLLQTSDLDKLATIKCSS